jgi:hypothetical protein
VPTGGGSMWGGSKCVGQGKILLESIYLKRGRFLSSSLLITSTILVRDTSVGLLTNHERVSGSDESVGNCKLSSKKSSW